MKKPIEKKPPKSKAKNATAGIGGAQSKKLNDKRFPIVGLGASAGGLEALRSFFAQVRPNSGMAFIVVVHMTPNQPSLMPELLQKVTKIPVSTAQDGQTIEPDHIYVIPPSKEISIFKGRIQLMDIAGAHAAQPIDSYLKSLSLDQGTRAVAVILSGTGSDGTLGIKEIKANDGLVLVQTVESAGYDGMPRSAINTGVVDMVLAPEAMPEKIIQYFAHFNHVVAKNSTTTNDQGILLNKIFAILRTHTGHDFSQYKLNTLLRRITRRMGLNQIDKHEQYVRFLKENPTEVEALFQELLIGVTNFFRDPESFDVLKTSILPDLFNQMKEDATFRAWIPGCSTGEEVYSLAMVIREVLEANPKRINLQLFGTDIDNRAIDKARAGLYPESISADVSKDRLKRFFIKEGGFYRIRKETRDCAVFSVQNLIKDPPFSRLNLLCCRNVLIYLNLAAQKKLLPLFHYTLAPKGVLVLGSSETIGGFSKLFSTLDKKWKIFKRREVPPALYEPIDFPSGSPSADIKTAIDPMLEPDHTQFNMAQVIQKAVFEQLDTAALLIDAKGNILFVQGRTGKYLETAIGPPTQNILEMARAGLRIELSSAIREAKSTNHKIIRKKIGVKTNGDYQFINLHVCPQTEPKGLAGRLLVIFEEVEPPLRSDSQLGTPEDHRREPASMAELERELQNTREGHQTAIEELESSNEELKSINEELQSTNEELQSTNEELESSKEELQSVNEELHTVNAELQSKVGELSATHDDMRNLLNSTQIATIFVDNTMRVKRFTPEAVGIVNLIQTDIGRPLQHVATNLTYTDMITDISDVLKNLTPKQVEVMTAKGDWYKMRIFPYRTMDNRIEGAVLTFASINEQKQSQQILSTANQEMTHAWRLVRNAFDLNPDPLVVLDREAKMVIANSVFAKVMKIAPDEVEGMDVLKIKNGLIGRSDLKAKLKVALENGKDFQVVASGKTQSAGIEKYIVTGRVICADDERPHQVLLHFTEQQRKASKDALQ